MTIPPFHSVYTALNEERVLMTDNSLNIPHILAEHRKWLAGDGGACANLAGSNLAGSNLAGVNLACANLVGSNLADSNLAGSNLACANLVGSNLADSNLAGSNLAGVNLAGSNLAGVNHIIDGGQRLDGYRFIGWLKSGVLMVSAGCRNFTMPEASEHWTRTRAGTALGEETMAILDHIERVAKARGWEIA